MITPSDIVPVFGGIAVEDCHGDMWQGRQVDLLWQTTNCNTCEVECGDFLYGLIRYLKPYIIAETGTYFGFSTACMALALRENHIAFPSRAGHIWTIDKYEGGAEDRLKTLELDDYVTLLRGDSLSDVLPNAMLGSPNLVFIDGGQRGDEYEKYLLLLAEGGVLAIHDTLLWKGLYDYLVGRGVNIMWAGRGLGLVFKGRQ